MWFFFFWHHFLWNYLPPFCQNHFFNLCQVLPELSSSGFISGACSVVAVSTFPSYFFYNSICLWLKFDFTSALSLLVYSLVFIGQFPHSWSFLLNVIWVHHWETKRQYNSQLCFWLMNWIDWCDRSPTDYERSGIIGHWSW